MSTEPTSPTAALSFNFGMSAFENVIVNNFKAIEIMLINQQA